MNRLNNITRQFGLELSDVQISQFQKYYELLDEWNKVMNLTAIVEENAVIYKHFADSLLLFKYKNLHEKLSIIDIGTGAGFPGIPLKIAFPELELTLMDSLQKRLNFLNEVIDNLGLEGVKTVHMRAEEGGKNPLYREKYDLVVSRAVANMTTLSEWCIPFVKVGGYFIPYKASGLSGELKDGKKAVRLLGGQIENIFTSLLPGTDNERSFVFVKKISSTDKRYPRTGAAAKKPLV